MTKLWQRFQADFYGKRVLILGLGLQGRGLSYTLLLAEAGAKLVISDLKSESELAPSLSRLKGIPFLLLAGSHDKIDLSEIDVIFRNPSVSITHPILLEARAQGIPIKMDTSLYFSYAKPHMAIGITGTRGKSTTTALIHHGLLAAGAKAIKCGNIAPESMLEYLKNPPDEDVFLVTELSSWQLQGFHDEQVSPRFAVLTNIYEDHLLDRSFEEYQYDKSAIFSYQHSDEWLVTNAKNQITLTMAKDAPSQIKWFSSNTNIPSQLSGGHNQENLSAASAVLDVLGYSQPGLFTSFSGLPFRQELIRTVDGVRYINDTTSTTPIATIKALETFPGEVFIVGGSTKKLPVEDLIQSLNEKADKIILLSGSGTQEIASTLDQSKVVAECDSLKSAVMTAKKIASSGQAVVFSPGFTSFGLFTNEFDRGRQFNQIVESL